MQHHFLFPSVISVGEVPNFLEIKEEIQAQTDTINRLLIPDAFKDNLFATFSNPRCIIKHLSLVKTEMVITKMVKIHQAQLPKFVDKQVVLDESWINVTAQHGYQDKHEHFVDSISGVLYLNVPERSGSIDFYPVVTHYSAFYREEFQPYTGMLAIFHGAIPHRVSYNKSNYQRITLAFNYKII